MEVACTSQKFAMRSGWWWHCSLCIQTFKIHCREMKKRSRHRSHIYTSELNHRHVYYQNEVHVWYGIHLVAVLLDTFYQWRCSAKSRSQQSDSDHLKVQSHKRLWFCSSMTLGFWYFYWLWPKFGIHISCWIYFNFF